MEATPSRMLGAKAGVDQIQPRASALPPWIAAQRKGNCLTRTVSPSAEMAAPLSMSASQAPQTLLISAA